ncbi:hypothetical protein ACFQO4_20835 [Saliphagus sp. GCM10025334]
MAESQSERPEPQRTIIVERAHLLHDQLEYSEESIDTAEDSEEEAYHTHRVGLTEDYIDALEGDGLSEATVHETVETAREEIDGGLPASPEEAQVYAELDAAQQILRRYFDETPNVLEVGAVGNVSGYTNGEVEFEGTGGKAIMEFNDEITARAAADCILDGVGAEEDAALVGQR